MKFKDSAFTPLKHETTSYYLFSPTGRFEMKTESPFESKNIILILFFRNENFFCKNEF